MLIDVLNRIATDVSLKPSDNRTRLIDVLNRGAREMYNRLECNKIYFERTVSVPFNKIITLPSYVGELRGMRTSISEMPFDIYGLSSPRYIKKTWDYKWMNWRDLGESPVMQLPSLIGPVSFSFIAETTPITVTISGQTDKATRIEERVLLDVSPKITVNNFGPQIYAISALSPSRTCDITISDANGIILAVLPNVDNKTRFKMIDVSEFGWPQDAPDGTNSFIDILYKVPLRTLTQDTDQFPAGDDYDNAWYYAAMWQYYLNSQNKGSEAQTWEAQMLVALKSVKDGTEGQLMEKITFGRNKYFDAVRNSANPDDMHQGSGKPSAWPYYGSWES